jgi:TolB-like protein
MLRRTTYGSPTVRSCACAARISVVFRDAALTYKDPGADARQIGRELEVRYLLEGSVVLEREHA